MSRFLWVLVALAAIIQSVATSSQKLDEFPNITELLPLNFSDNTMGRKLTTIDSDGDKQFSSLLQLHSFALANVLAGGSGIRATVPMFLISVMHSISPESVPLVSSMQWLGHWYVCFGLGILLIVEIVADVIPAVDHVLHAVLTPMAPLAGALMALAPDYWGGAYTHVPMAIFGAGLAFAAHSGKAAFRAGSTATTGGTMNCFASLVGTIGLTFTIIISIFFAMMSIFLAICVVIACVYSAFFLKKAAKRFFPSTTEKPPSTNEVVIGNTEHQPPIVEPIHIGTNAV